jgi:uncharacterized membrane protein YbhN (UPF0104 family)
MTARHWTWFWRVVRLAILVVAVRTLWVFPRVATGRALLSADARLLWIALVVNLASLVAKGWSWHLLLEPLAPHRMRAALEATIIGAAVNNLSVSVVGEGERACDLARQARIPLPTVVLSIAWARGIEGVAFAILLLTTAFLLPMPAVILALQVGIGVAILVLFAVVCLGRGKHLPARAPAWARDLSVAFSGMSAPRTLVFPLVLTLFNWLAEWATYDLTLRSVHVPLSYAASLSALLATNVGGALRLTPANVGVFQASMFAGLLPFGVAAEHAVAAGLVLQAVHVLPVFALAGLLVGWRRLRNRGRVQSASPA